MSLSISDLQPSVPSGKQISVAWRLFAFGALSAVIFLCFSAWLWSALGGMNEVLRHEVKKTTDLALLAKDMQRHVIQVQQSLTDVSATRGLDGLDDGFEKAKEHPAAFREALATFEQAQREGDFTFATGQLETLNRNFESYYAAGVAMAKAYVEGGHESGNALMGPFDAASESFQEQVEPFVKGFESALLQAETDVEKRCS
jgi:methyl-accepting chemotaxis protein